MTLNHLNLAVADVPLVQQFLTTYFNLQPVTKPSPALTVLRDEAGMILTLSNFDRVAEVSYPAHFHIGFVQDSEEQVNALHARLQADGIEASTPHRFHGSWTFYLHAPGSLLIEVLH